MKSSDHLQITYKKKPKLSVIVSLRETGTEGVKMYPEIYKAIHASV